MQKASQRHMRFLGGLRISNSIEGWVIVSQLRRYVGGETIKKPMKPSRNHLTIAVLGDKNHGKSTLLGRLLFETGNIPQDRVRKIKKTAKESGKRFEWAHILDSFGYERENAMTLDAARATAEISRTVYEFIDTPGDRELTKNMLTGASRAEFAILVVAADEGIKPQTIQHLEIMRFLGISRAIAVINKCDCVKYSQNKFAQVKDNLTAELQKYGFQNTPVLPSAANIGCNITRRSQRLPWFGGPTLAEAVKKYFKPPTRKIRQKTNGPLLMSVQDVYAGSIIVGQIKNGKIKLGQRIKVVPGKKLYTVRKIISGNTAKKRALAGDNTGVVLDSGPDDIKRGDILTTERLSFVRVVNASCLFIKKLETEKLTLETGFQKSEAKIKPADEKSAIGKPRRCRIVLKKRMPVLEKFVLKENEIIVGLCKTA